MAAPWYARVATTAGRPAVLGATLIMSMPGEYHVAKFAGWTDPWAYGMPFSLSAYAGIAAVVAATRPKGARGRFSATVGAAFAIVLALAAQVVAHLVTTGHMDHDQAWLIAVTSMVPPAVLAHLLHLAATPTPATESVPAPAPAPAVTVERTEEPPAPVTAAVPPKPEQAPALPPVEDHVADTRKAITYRDPRCAAIRPLYDDGTRPGTAAMRDALIAAGYGRVGDSTIRGDIRAEIEKHEPHLKQLPPAIGRTA
ncbi:hypothetical protein [Streptomyces sp. NPDC001781]